MIRRQIGNAVLYHGDCFEILPEISGANCMITDPPYGCTKNDWDYAIDLDRFWQLGKAACKDNAPFCLFCQMPFAARLYMSNAKMFRYEWIYKKEHPTGFLDANRKPLRLHENIYIFCDRIPKFNPQMSKGASYKKSCALQTKKYNSYKVKNSINKSGERYPTTIINIGGGIYSLDYENHPTQKNIKVLCYLVKTYTDEDDTVIDPFMGSGTTGVAAVRHGRNFIGIEQEEKWFDVACKRIEAEYAKRSLLDIEPQPKPQPPQACLGV